MVITSCLLLIVAWKFWGWSLPVVIAVIAPFLAIELVFLGSNALKIPHGGWFPLVVGAVLFTLMWTWRKGVAVLGELTRRGRPQLSDFIREAEARGCPEAPGTAVFLTGNAEDVPQALLNNLKHNGVLHERNVILTVLTEEVPRLADEGRVATEIISDRFSRTTIRFGFMEAPNVPKALTDAGWDVGKGASIKAAGVLKLTINATFSPLEFKDPETNEFKGLDIELVDALAAKLGLKVERTDGPFAQLIPALTTGPHRLHPVGHQRHAGAPGDDGFRRLHAGRRAVLRPERQRREGSDRTLRQEGRHDPVDRLSRPDQGVERQELRRAGKARRSRSSAPRARPTRGCSSSRAASTRPSRAARRSPSPASRKATSIG